MQCQQQLYIVIQRVVYRVQIISILYVEFKVIIRGLGCFLVLQSVLYGNFNQNFIEFVFIFYTDVSLLKGIGVPSTFIFKNYYSFYEFIMSLTNLI